MRQTAFLAAFFSMASVLPAADPGLLNLIMPDAKIVGGVSVAKAETSPFGQFILRSMTPDANFQEFVAASGFDPRTDLTEVLFASNTTPKTGIGVARGIFNAPKISAAALAQGMITSSVYAGARLLVSTGPNQHAMAIYPDSASATLALGGDLASVKAALDRRALSNAVNPLLASKIAMYSAADAWTVSIVPLASLTGTAQPAAGPLAGILQTGLLQKVQQSSGGITFGSPVMVTGEVVADTPQDAIALADVVKFLAQMAQTSTGPQAASVAAIAQTLDVTTISNTVSIALSIPEAQLEKILESGKSRKAAII